MTSHYVTAPLTGLREVRDFNLGSGLIALPPTNWRLVDALLVLLVVLADTYLPRVLVAD